MTICKYFLCFAIFSFIGWLYESVYYTIQQRKVINSGFLNTCFCPIYGIGAMLDLVLLGWIENTYALFFAGMLVTGILEYFVSWLMETLFHKRWWDYTGWPLNINGRVCIIGGIAFGLFTVVLIKYIAPFTFGMIDSMSMFSMAALAFITAAVMLTDTVISIKYMDTSKLWYVDKQEEFFAGIANGKCGSLVRKIKDNLKK